MMEISKIRMRRLYRAVLYGFAAYGLLQSPLCSRKAHGATLESLVPEKQVVMQYDAPRFQDGLEKKIHDYMAADKATNIAR